MRYPKEHKEQSRQRLVESAGRLAKKRGFAAAGVDDLAAAAGVTSGSVYRHFGGKSALLAAIIRTELERSASMLASVEPGDERRLDRALAAYLSAEHVDSPETGCPLPSLASDVARADASVRQAFEAGLRSVHAALKRHVRSDDASWALIAQSVGAVMLARAMQDEAERNKVLASARRNVRRLVRSGEGGG